MDCRGLTTKGTDPAIATSNMTPLQRHASLDIKDNCRLRHPANRTRMATPKAGNRVLNNFTNLCLKKIKIRMKQST